MIIEKAAELRKSGYMTGYDERAVIGSDGEETVESFVDRVFDATGIALAAIQDGVPEDMLAGHIFCRRGPTAVVSYGYPVETSDGPVYREFRVIDRTPDLPAFLQGTALIRLWGISGDLRSELTGTHSEARERAYELGGSGPSVTWGGRLVLPETWSSEPFGAYTDRDFEEQ